MQIMVGNNGKMRLEWRLSANEGSTSITSDEAIELMLECALVPSLFVSMVFSLS